MTAVKFLLHKKALPIALESLRTFMICCKDPVEVEIHSDGSLDAGDVAELARVVGRSDLKVVGPAERAPVVAERLKNFPRIAALLAKRSFFVKFEVFIFVERPFFYFDSDIVWTRPFVGLAELKDTDYFSLDPWTWYFGARQPAAWIRRQALRRLNSGFIYLRTAFPYQELEDLLAAGFFDAEDPSATDQELLAYLFPKGRMFSERSFARVRGWNLYDLAKVSSVALHYAGARWVAHIDAIRAFQPPLAETPHRILSEAGASLSWKDFILMKLHLELTKFSLFRRLLLGFRKMRARLT
jgi:hypothetical protein